MHVLFAHPGFPAQFGHLALELTKRYGWKCSCLFYTLSRALKPSQEMLTRLDLHQIPLPPGFRLQSNTPWTQSYGRYLELCEVAFEAVRAIPDLRPDLVVSHAGLGPTLFLPEVLDCPIINYCEYHFA